MHKIRSTGCDCELGVIGGHKENQAKSVASGPCPRGGVICQEENIGKHEGPPISIGRLEAFAG